MAFDTIRSKSSFVALLLNLLEHGLYDGLFDSVDGFFVRFDKLGVVKELLLFISIPRQDTMQRNRYRKIRTENLTKEERVGYNLPYTEIVKSGVIRLTC